MVSLTSMLPLLALCFSVQPTTAGSPSATCTFTGGFTGVGNANCAGSDGEVHSDILSCPSQPGAVDIICPPTLSNGLETTCGGIIGPNSYCDVWNSDVGGGKEDIQLWCYCVNGNFCCDQNAEVAGGQGVVGYYNDVGCNCDG